MKSTTAGIFNAKGKVYLTLVFNYVPRQSHHKPHLCVYTWYSGFLKFVLKVIKYKYCSAVSFFFNFNTIWTNFCLVFLYWPMALFKILFFKLIYLNWWIITILWWILPGPPSQIPLPPPSIPSFWVVPEHRLWVPYFIHQTFTGLLCIW